MRRTSRLLYVVFVVVIVFASYGPASSETAKNAGEIGFHKAIMYQDMSSNAEYVKATTADFAFSESARHFPESGVFIRKDPDLILNSTDLAAIEILGEKTDDPIQQYLKDKADYKSAPGPNLIINFWLTDTGAKKMIEYSKKNIGSYLAMKINHQVFAVAHLMEPLEKAISLHFSRITADELKTKLLSLKKDIIVKESAVK